MDILQREGKYPLPPQASQTIMGVEFSGTVTKLGSDTKRFKEGDEVFGLTYGVSLMSPSVYRISTGIWSDVRGLMPNMLYALKLCYFPNLRSYHSFKLLRFLRSGWLVNMTFWNVLCFADTLGIQRSKLCSSRVVYRRDRTSWSMRYLYDCVIRPGADSMD